MAQYLSFALGLVVRHVTLVFFDLGNLLGTAGSLADGLHNLQV